jgi:hypothetical protein
MNMNVDVLAWLHDKHDITILYLYSIAPGKGSKKAAAKDSKKADAKKGSGRDKDKVCYI